MLIVDADGLIPYATGSKIPQTSDHPVYKARVDLALGLGEWLYAPTSGHNLARFKRVGQTAQKMQEFQKETALYLSKYSPDVKEAIVERGGLSMDLEISDEALNVL